jgi:protein subunit release factor A
VSLDERLAELSEQARHLHAELARPEVAADPDALRRIGKELARIEPTVAAHDRLEATRRELVSTDYYPPVNRVVAVPAGG